MNTKTCRQCTLELPISSFQRAKAYADGYNSMCKSCRSLAKAEAAEKLTEEQHTARLKSRRAYQQKRRKTIDPDVLKAQRDRGKLIESLPAYLREIEELAPIADAIRVDRRVLDLDMDISTRESKMAWVRRLGMYEPGFGHIDGESMIERRLRWLLGRCDVDQELIDHAINLELNREAGISQRAEPAWITRAVSEMMAETNERLSADVPTAEQMAELEAFRVAMGATIDCDASFRAERRVRFEQAKARYGLPARVGAAKTALATAECEEQAQFNQLYSDAYGVAILKWNDLEQQGEIKPLGVSVPVVIAESDEERLGAARKKLSGKTEGAVRDASADFLAGIEAGFNDEELM